MSLSTSAEVQLQRLKAQIGWITRITTALGSASNLDDLYSIIVAGIISPTGLSYSQVVLFALDEGHSRMKGKYALFHESAQSIQQLALEMEEDARFIEEQAERKKRDSAEISLREEPEMDSLASGIQWVTLFQQLNPDNPITHEIQEMSFPAAPENGTALGEGPVFEEVLYWRSPRAHSKKVLGKRLPASLAAQLPEYFCMVPLYTHKGVRAVLFVDRHLEEDKPISRDDLSELDWFMRQASLAMENVEARIDLATAYHELKQLDQMKSNFLSIISHELRTPLTSMSGFVDLILEERVGTINENQRTLLSRVGKNTAHLIQLVNDLIEVAEIEAEGTVEVEMALVEPLAVLMNTLPRLEQRRRTNNVKVVPVVEEEVPRIMTDERALGRIFFHLLDNAMKFSFENSEVQVRFHVEDRDLHIDFCDMGTGISEESLKHIFKQFYQVDNTLTRGHEGLGLGLAVTKMLINATHGQIRVKSEFGKGSIFSVVYPVYVPREITSY
jgi:signal transduction histidine kinase